MKIGLSAKSASANAMVDDRFARGAVYVIYDTETKQYEFITPDELGAHGAGPKAVQLFAEKGVKVIIAPALGQNAYGAAQVAKIDAYTQKNGTVEENIKSYLDGTLEKITTPKG